MIEKILGVQEEGHGNREAAINVEKMSRGCGGEEREETCRHCERQRMCQDVGNSRGCVERVKGPQSGEEEKEKGGKVSTSCCK